MTRDPLHTARLARTASLGAVAAASIGLLVTACATSPSAPASDGTAVAPGLLQVDRSSLGSYLADGSGHALYFFAPDTAGHSTCTGSCLTYWPIEPAPAGTTTTGPGVDVRLGTLTRPDGAHQLTVDGLPVYTYVGDSAPGMTAGQGLNTSGGLWWLITPTGQALKTSEGATTTSSPTARPGY